MSSVRLGVTGNLRVGREHLRGSDSRTPCALCGPESLEAPGEELTIRSVRAAARKREAAPVHLLEPVLEHGSVDLLEEVERDPHQIGRAAWRERVENSVGAGPLETK